MAITESEMNAIREMFMEAGAELLAKERVVLAEMFKGERAVTNERFDKIDKRFEKIDARLDGIDGRFEKIDERLDGIDGRLESIEGDISSIKIQIGEMNIEVAKLNLTAKVEAVKRTKRG